MFIYCIVSVIIKSILVIQVTLKKYLMNITKVLVSRQNDICHGGWSIMKPMFVETMPQKEKLC